VRATTVVSVILSDVRIEVSNPSFDPGVARLRWVASLRSIEAARLASRIAEPTGRPLGRERLFGNDRAVGGR
jgi:hypothetical protein